MGINRGGVRTLKSGRVGNGYTIVETLIFLALTSFLLLVAVRSMTDWRQRTEFNQAVFDFESRMRDVINDVPVGYFPENGLECYDNGGSLAIRPTTVTTGVGSTNDCIYLGKVLHFNPDSGIDMHVYTVAGDRSVTELASPSLELAEPIAVVDGAGTYEEVSFVNGLEVTEVFKGSESAPLNGSKTLSLVGVFTDLSGTSLSSGNSSVQAVRVGGVQPSHSAAGFGVAQAETRIANIPSPSPNVGFVTYPEGIEICLKASNDKRASVNIGASAPSSVELSIEGSDGYRTECDTT